MTRAAQLVYLIPTVQGDTEAEMAKSRSKNNTTESSLSRREVRVTSVNASRSRLDFAPMYRPVLTPLYQPIFYEDRRTWHPDGQFKWPSASPRAAAQVVARNARATRSSVGGHYSFRPKQSKAVLAFAAPHKVAVCVRRQVRKEVLFARGVGGGKVRKPRHNAYSKFHC